MCANHVSWVGGLTKDGLRKVGALTVYREERNNGKSRGMMEQNMLIEINILFTTTITTTTTIIPVVMIYNQ